MVKDFETELRAVIKRSGPGSRSRVEQDLKALRAAGVNSFDSLVEVLTRKGERADVRLSACWLTGQLRDQRAVSPLLAIFGNESESTWEAAKALGILGSKRAVPLLIKILSEAEDEEKRAAAAYSLGLLRDARSLTPLLNVLSDRDRSPKLRSHAAEALGYLKDKRAFDILLSALKDASPEVRYSVAFSLGEIGDRRALPELERLAATDDAAASAGPVREIAQEAIRRINSL